jgi:serine-type D-Ala-D-Ala carboxypeptidase (penicillin-binding protein 5/6)
MKPKYIVLILLIVAIHALMIYFFLTDDDTPKQQEPVTQEEAVVEQEEIPLESEEEIAQTIEEEVVEEEIAEVPLKNPRLGKRLKYTLAVTGNISAVPSSKLAQTGILVDLDSRNVLWAKDPRKAVPIASMTKMMTTLLVFEAIEKKPELTMETPIKVSKTAAYIGGSQVWLDVKETFALKDLIKTMIIHSANDSAELVGEVVGGDREGFVEIMNNRARELRMGNTKFYNPHGLPFNTTTENTSCCEAMVLLSENLLEYPQAMAWSSTWIDYIREHTNKPTQIVNRNKLVKYCEGVDGMKTGYTNRSKFCITATCMRKGRRLVAVVTGFPTSKERNSFIEKLFEWGYKRNLNGGLIPK